MKQPLTVEVCRNCAKFRPEATGNVCEIVEHATGQGAITDSVLKLCKSNGWKVAQCHLPGEYQLRWNTGTWAEYLEKQL